MKNVAEYNTTNNLGASPVGSTTHLAVQHRLGLLSERGTGFGGRHFVDSRRHRTRMNGRERASGALTHDPADGLGRAVAFRGTCFTF